MKVLTNISYLCLLVAACGDNAPQTPDAGRPALDAPGVDAAPPIDAAPAPTVVAVQTGIEPALVAFRDDARADWQALDVAGKSSFEVRPTGPYHVVIVCVLAGTATATEYARTPADGTELLHLCGRPKAPLLVRGTLAESGTVSIAGNARGMSRAPWDFALPAAPDTYDLGVLFGDLAAPDRVALRRDLVVAADVDVGTLDADSMHAEELEAITFTPTNLNPKEQVSTQSFLDVHNSTLLLRNVRPGPQRTWDTVVAPASLLRASDGQRVRLEASTRMDGGITTFRTVGRTVHAGDSTDVTLPAPLAPVVFTLTGERFSAPIADIAAGLDVSLFRESATLLRERVAHQEIRISARFRAAATPTEAVVDFTGVPGFQDAWRVDPTLAQARRLEAAQRTSFADFASASVFASIPAP